MDSPTILVSVRYPLENPGVRTLRRALGLVKEIGSAHLYVLHVNLLHQGKKIGRDELARAVESAVGPIRNASYHVRNAFLLEEAILYEAVQQEVDYVVVGRDTKARWRQVLATRLDLDVDLDGFLRRHLGAKLIVA